MTLSTVGRRATWRNPELAWNRVSEVLTCGFPDNTVEDVERSLPVMWPNTSRSVQLFR